MTDGYPLMNWQNPKRRALLLQSNSVIVMSECCGAQVDGHHQPDPSDWRNPVWARCTNCEKLLEENPYQWKSVINLKGLTEEGRDGGVYWEDWGWYWFGLRGYGMKVDF